MHVHIDEINILKWTNDVNFRELGMKIFPKGIFVIKYSVDTIFPLVYIRTRISCLPHTILCKYPVVLGSRILNK